MAVSLNLWMVVGVGGGEKTLHNLPHVQSLRALPECLSYLLQMGILVWTPVQNSWLFWVYWISVVSNNRTLPICGTMGFLTIWLYCKIFCTQWFIRTGYVDISKTVSKRFFPWGSERKFQVKSKGELSLHWTSENFSVLN